jgi:hypothetical protein
MEPTPTTPPPVLLPTTHDLVDALNPAVLLDTYVAFAPWILAILSIIIAISLVKWGITSALNWWNNDQHFSFYNEYDQMGDSESRLERKQRLADENDDYLEAMSRDK